MSLVTGWVPVVVPVVAVLAVLAGVDWRHPGGRRAFATATVAAALLTAGLWWSQLRWRLIPYDVAATTYAWVALALLSVCAAVRRRSVGSTDGAQPGPSRPADASLPTDRRPADANVPRRGRARLAVSVLAVPVAVLAMAVAVNRQYGYYPTLASLGGDGGLRAQSMAAFDRARRHGLDAGRGAGRTGATTTSTGTSPRATTTRPRGTLVKTTIPGPVSGFSTREAWIWAPPLFVQGAVSQPPVVVLLAGSPGQTADWLRGGNADVTAQAYADRHDGVAPMLVLPDANGSALGDTECVDSARGRAETYLTQDVPAFVTARFGVDARHWAVAGLSEGGTCAAMLSLRHPSLFVAFAGFSGLTSPTVTESVDRSATARALFDGDTAAYDQHDPLWLLAHDPPRSVEAYWQSGDDDAPARAAQTRLAAAARSAGMTVRSVETPGQGHSFTFWTRAFADALPVLMAATSARGR